MSIAKVRETWHARTASKCGRRGSPNLLRLEVCWIGCAFQANDKRIVSSTFSSAGALDSLALAAHVGEQILCKGVFDLNQR